MTWTLCTSGAAIAKAGANANTTIIASGALLSTWSTEAEGRISAECHTDATGFTGQILAAAGDACSSLIAQNIIAYDTTGYLAREADTLLNVNDDRYTRALNIIKNKENQRLSS